MWQSYKAEIKSDPCGQSITFEKKILLQSCNVKNLTFKKWLSYHGAVRALAPLKHLFVDHKWAYICEHTGERYFDPTNAVYRSVLMECWPQAMSNLGLSNPETIGDLAEALLGFAWLRTKGRQQQLGPIAEDVIEQLEIACFAKWLKSQSCAVI